MVEKQKNKIEMEEEIMIKKNKYGEKKMTKRQRRRRR
jgi:hypothetical protein